MTDKTSQSWEEIGRGAAAQTKITPEEIRFIEARGFLCHELLYLVGGHVQFVETSWRQLVLKILEYLFPILPICRWYPPENCVLEWIGDHVQCETKVYRVKSSEGPIAVFFVIHKPELSTRGGYIHSLFNVPQLDLDRFLQPPFEEGNDSRKIEELLRVGLVENSGPLPMTSGARKRVREINVAIRKGLWEKFSK